MPATAPIIAAPIGLTASHPAVIATNPAREPFKDIDTSGLPYFIHVNAIVTQVAIAAAKFVFTNTFPARAMLSPSIETVEAPLKPNQQNHKIKHPNAPNVKECPGIAFGLPSLPYLPIRGPNIAAPTRAATPPVICTAVEPAKSWNPISESQPPPQIQ